MGITDKQWWRMCDSHMSMPIPLAEADLSKPFVYDREYGVFYVPGGYHQSAMSLLLAFSMGFDDGIDLARHLGVEYSSGTADRWLETRPGAVYRSAVASELRAGRRGDLTIIERRFFGKVQYQLSDEN